MSGKDNTQNSVELSEIRFRELFNNMSSGVAVYEAVNEGQDFIFIDFNRSAERIENVKKEEILGRSVMEVFPGVKDFGLFDVFQRVWKTGNPEHHPVSVYRDHRISGWRENYVYRLPSGEVVAIYEDVTGRKQAEEALKESEEMFRLTFEHASNAMCLVGLNSRFLRVNDAMCKMLGYSERELLSMTFREVTHPDDLSVSDVWVRQLLESKAESKYLEKRYIHKAGHIVWGIVHASLLCSSGGSPLFFTTHIQDITKRKQAEEALRESEVRYRRITDAVTDYIYTVSLENGSAMKTRHGPGCQAVTGYSEEEFAADPYLWFRMVAEDDRPVVQEQARRVLAGEGAPAIEHRIIRKDGVRRWVRNTFVPRYDNLGRLQAYDGLVQDITERKNAEEALYFAEKKFRDMLENVQLAAVMLDLGGNITFCNDYLLGLTGWNMEEALNKNWFDMFIPEESRAAVKSVFKANTEKGSMLHNENHIITREGSLRLIVWNIVVLYGREGGVIGTASIGIDVTEHRKLEEQLRQSQKMEAVGHLAGGVAHDFNNILNGIMGYQFLIDMKLKSDDPLKNYLNEIYELAKRGANLTHSLLAFSRKQVIDPKPVNINDIILGMEKILNRIIGEDIEFRVNVAEEDLITKVDKGQMEQVLMNLAANARDAMPHGGMLIIGTGKVEIDDRFIQINHYGELGKYVFVSVSDTGIGMDEKIKENIFEPFFTTKEVGKGTGLGLAMAYGTIKQHNGFINVYSEPGQGATFKIYLPLMMSEVEKEEKGRHALLSFGNETILIAEDDEGVRNVTRITLETYGYKVLEAIDGEEAMRIFSENIDGIKLIVTDVIMPKKHGKELYEEARRINPDIKCLFMSGYTDDILNSRGVLGEGVNFIAKPVIPENLIIRVREILDS